MKIATFICILFSTTCALATSVPVPGKIAPALPDAVSEVSLSEVQVHGWLGERIDRNIEARLKVVDVETLLAGYEHRPGEHPWIGEHVGKWMHAATLAWVHTGDEALRRKLDAVALRLIATQEEDGYLGTYTKDKRMKLVAGADWDVWSHKYCMIGLQTYHRYTGDEAALNAARKAADHLLATFPREKSILAAGTHRGMAATSVLEPMVDLYQLTGEPKYRDFARYIVAAYDEAGGPKIVQALLSGRGVSQVANAKAYEMLSNIKGLLDFACMEGNRDWLRAVENAWTDITTHRLYVTGTASSHEVFVTDDELPNGVDAHTGETCVTTTWIQLNQRLLRLTADAKYAAELERSYYNHLTAAQNPRGDDWCYYTALEGKKRYDREITCCHSSGPRVLAMSPGLAYLQDKKAIYVNTIETSQAHLKVGRTEVTIEQRSGFPTTGKRQIVVHTAEPVRFALRVFRPASEVKDAKISSSGWFEVSEREWREGDQVDLSETLELRRVVGKGTNTGRSALKWGPFVLTLDDADNADVEWVGGSLRVVPEAPAECSYLDGRLKITTALLGSLDDNPRTLHLVPFADAGAKGSTYRMWFRSPLDLSAEALTQK